MKLLQWGCCIYAITVLFSINSPASKLLADNTTDHLALLSFKSLISDPSGALSSWNDTLHFCQWQGVSCSSSRHPERVTALQLDSLNLTGNLSPSLSNLTFLKKLHLSTNRLQGHIPQELSLLPRLQYLNLSYNSLEGGIPANLSQCSDLRGINLSYNSLTGMIPMDLGFLSKLLHLNLGTNSFSGGIPSSIGNISTLTEILLESDGLEGSIPESFGKLRRLRVFQVSINKLSGEIPSSIYNLSGLEYFVAGENQLVGSLPSYMFDVLPRLHMLLLNDNGFHGPIPSSLPNATEIVELDLKSNMFGGRMPSNLGNLKNLYWINLANNSIEANQIRDWSFLTSMTNCSLLGTLALDKNRLEGELPNSIANLSARLDWLSMSQNRISGSIPEGIGNLANLTVLSLHTNTLSGAIPASIGMLRKLHTLDLSRNRFVGQIPPSVGSLTQLNRLLFEESGLTGNVPVSFANCRNLEVLVLSHNNLTGAIPKELLSLSSLSYLYLQLNRFEGALPVEVKQLKNLDVLDVSHNKLSGNIPSSLGECQILEYLYMQGNFFQGSIPESLSDLKGLQQLDLSSNNLSGHIPESLGKLTDLLYLNLSFNNLEGSVPKGVVFRNMSAFSILGNSKLCGGVTGLHLPACYTPSSESSGKNHLSLVLKVIIPVVCVLFCVPIIMLVFAVLHWRNSKRKPSPAYAFENSFMRVTYAELCIATNGFSSENIIGTESFGSVYKGILGSIENVVAVKVLNLEQTGAAKSFLAECEILRNIRHRNLIRILTTCSTSDSNGNDFKALVLEFMSNGSLEEWLHRKTPKTSESRTLSFTQRLNIAIDVAYALDYLHNHGDIPIVHCDLKPSNVLLDEDMHAHVGDFGLAKFLSSEKSSIYGSTTIFNGIKGSIGYIAPEYGMHNQVSTEGDVYSYGILLLEMFTGKRPTDDILPDGIGLRGFVQRAFPHQVLDVVDPSLFNREDDPQVEGSYLKTSEIMADEQNFMASVLKIGLSCSEEDPRKRMEISSVVSSMLAVKNQLVNTNTHSGKYEEI